MRDGTVLRANVLVPTDPKTGKPARGPFPVIMVQTPYGKDTVGAASGGDGGAEAATQAGPLPYTRSSWPGSTAGSRTGTRHRAAGALRSILRHWRRRGDSADTRTGGAAKTLFFGDRSLGPRPPRGELAGSDSIAYTPATSPCARPIEQWAMGAGALAFMTGDLPPRTVQPGRSLPPGRPGRADLHDRAAAARRSSSPARSTPRSTRPRPPRHLLVANDRGRRPRRAVEAAHRGRLLGSFRKLDRSETWFGPEGRPLPRSTPTRGPRCGRCPRAARSAASTSRSSRSSPAWRRATACA